MKKIVLILTLAISALNLNAQKAEYYQAMGQNLQKLGDAKTQADFQNVANQFELIANKEKSEWLPLYYAAQSTILMVYKGEEKDKIDSYLDYAQKFIDKALVISENESEIHVLQGFLYQARIGVSPMSRGQKYVALAQASFEKAKALNPENPRVYYLMALNVFNTPKMFGGGKKNALPLFLQAKQKFDTFKPASLVLPNWGAKHNQEMIDKCQS
jgi:tetratricopeptide (TPR) repeat protein